MHMILVERDYIRFSMSSGCFVAHSPFSEFIWDKVFLQNRIDLRRIRA